jgi:diketogulonate reductase-like aldo/keto reductase
MQSVNSVTTSAGVNIPCIIYGSAWKKQQTAALVEQALLTGFRGFDTACQPKHYHEAGVGEGLQAGFRSGLHRSDIFLQTKFTPLNGHDPQQIPYRIDAGLSDQVAESFQVSLQNLQTDYVDSLLLHSPLPNREDFLEVWRAMERLRQAGGVKQLGVSNCYDVKQLQMLYQAAEIKPAVIQNRFYAETGYDKDIRVFCRENQIIYQSFWTLTANPHILSAKIIQSLAKKYSRSNAQIFFRFLTQIGVIPLTGTKDAQHMQEDLAIFEFELSDTQCWEINKLCD